MVRALPAALLTLIATALPACAGKDKAARAPSGSAPISDGHALQGIASWYGPGFDGKATANGETYDENALTAAHKTLPFGTRVLVHNADNGRMVWVRINDRGPYVDGRIIDLSYAAARAVEMVGPGTARVRLEIGAGAGARHGELAQAWYVQVGAFGDHARAASFAAGLSERGLQVEVVADGSLERVRVGPYPRREDAERDAEELERAGYDTLIVSAMPN